MRVLTIAAILLAACTTTREPSATTPLDLQSDYLTVPGGRIYYEVAGTGPAVVLIHGGFGDRRMWDAQFQALARDFRVVRYDHRGFGKSSVPDTAYSPVNDLVQLLDRLGMAKAHVVGNSMGGGLALDFAVLHPERVSKLVVVASGANGYPYTEADLAGMRTTFRVGAEHGADSAAALWLRDPMIAVASRHPRTAALVRQMILDNKNVFRMQAWPWESMKPRAYERLAELTMPVLLIVGEQDTPVVQKVATATASRLQNAALIRMRGADHLPQMVEPEAFTRRLTAFLQDD